MAAMTPDDLAVHADFLRRLASRLLQSPDLAEDAVQETLVLAWRKRPDVASPRGWLTQALRNRLWTVCTGRPSSAATARGGKPSP